MRESRVALHILANFVAISHRHEHVGQNQIRFDVGNFANGGFAIAHRNDVNTLIFQGKPDHLLNVAVVVRDKNLRHRRSSGNLDPAPSAGLPTHGPTFVLEHRE